MKITMLNTAYLAEDGYVIECEDQNSFARVLRILGTSDSTQQALEELKKKKIPFKLYRETTCS